MEQSKCKMGPIPSSLVSSLCHNFAAKDHIEALQRERDEAGERMREREREREIARLVPVFMVLPEHFTLYGGAKRVL